MNIVVCVDDAMGMSFNNRRQSQDRILREKILNITKGTTLWMSSYSAKQFTQEQQQFLMVSDDYLKKAEEGDYCYVERENLMPFLNKIEKVLLCKWNRRYPADVYFPEFLQEESWKGIILEEFTGSSHEKITIEEWDRMNNK